MPASDDSAPFSEVLRLFRTRAGISQEALAVAASLGVKTIASLEQGLRRMPYRRTVGAIADALGLFDADKATLVRSADVARQGARRASIRPDHEPAGGTFPTPSTSFVTRPEIAEIRTLMRSVRLLTVSGPGGIGKTRAAVEAVKSIDHATAPAYFADLVPCRSAEAAMQSIASALRIRHDLAEIDATALAAAIGDREMLIVFDGCEHVTGAVADIVCALLRSTTRLSVVVTSREPLGLSNETVFRLRPLALPSSPAAIASRPDSFPAVNLFLARAGLGESAAALPAEQLDMVVEICRRLEGNPLAIESAASQAATFGLRFVHERRERPLDTIVWSFELLDRSEQRLLQHLAIFRGGFTLAAVQSVCSDRTGSSDDVSSLLLKLIDKSLVEVVHPGATTRFALSETVRAFALDRLSRSGEQPVAALRHAQWMADEADRVGATHLSLAEGATRRNIDNARSAVRYALNAGADAHTILAARILRGYRRIWLALGHQAEHAALVEACLAKLGLDQHVRLASELLQFVPQFSEQGGQGRQTPKYLPRGGDELHVR
ncbi:MAG TPA: helix-turn-helix domain-containing protein [Candidatus Elarobacter sp.]|jgi:predicted ATPase/DNA-binding XRE family transcriptional regulator|nr:helix-turn-helix domain-containing protein [Candidatus Elarobacter sp.]